MDLSGTMVGRIRIIEPIGEGGMGTVFLGFDEKLKRDVAVKCIREDRRLDADAKGRFLREAQMLSQLDHRNICRIIDHVESDTHDFLILEYIKGEVLASVAQDLSFARKLDIALQITQALSAAHNLGIVHRDLKPANIMITDDFEVKVLDFGLARPERDAARPVSTWSPSERPGEAADGDDSGVLTEMGAIIGTPRYMSPEQCLGEPATAASDMFSLGLLFQELFTGEDPYGGATGQMELLYKATRGDTVPLKPGLDRDLASLILELQAIEPRDRPAAGAVQERLKFIIDRPKRRFRRRVALGVVLVLLLAVAASLWGLVSARRSEDRAVQAMADAQASHAEAEAVNQFLESMLGSARPSGLGREVKVVEVLDQAVADLPQAFGDLPAQRAAVMTTLGRTYEELGDYDRACDLLSEAHEIRHEMLSPIDDRTLATLNALVLSLQKAGRYEKAETKARQLLAICVANFGSAHHKTWTAQEKLAISLKSQGKLGEAESLDRDVYETRLAALGPDDEMTLTSQNNLAEDLRMLGRLDESRALHEAAYESRRRLLGERNPATLTSLNNLAITMAMTGDSEEAEELFRRVVDLRTDVLGENHPETLAALNNLAATLYQRQAYGEAAEVFQTMRDQAAKRLGQDHPRTLLFASNVGLALEGQGKLQDAVKIHRDVLTKRRRFLGDRHPHTLESVENLGLCHFKLGSIVEAEALHRQAFEARSEVLGESHPHTLTSLSNWIDCCRELGQIEQAISLCKRGLEICAETLGPEHEATLEFRQQLDALQNGLQGSSRSP